MKDAIGFWVLAATILASSMAFIDTFRVVSLIAAGLSWLSAVLAALLIEKQMTAVE